MTNQQQQARSYWVVRNGLPVKRLWEELTRTEKQQQQEAERRAAYVAMFNIYA